MKWISVRSKKPPLEKDILLGGINEGKIFWWDKVKVSRPFDFNIKYNPDYYEYIRGDSKRQLSLDDYWMEIKSEVDDG